MPRNDVSVSVSESIMENAEEAAGGLGAYEERRSRTFAVMAAALAAEGWHGKAADNVLGNAMGGYTVPELATAKAAARDVTFPWQEWGDATVASTEAADVLRRLLRQHQPTAAHIPEPGGTVLKLSAPPAEPRWAVRDFLPVGKVTMLSAPVHSLKTILREAMMVASLTGTPFLGRDVPPLKWMIVDGENSAEDIISRWAAFGLTDEHLKQVHLTTRDKRVRLGEPEWNDWLRREIEAFAPNVVVLDTVARVCAGVAVNDNDKVAALFADVLVPLVDRHEIALLFCHHARKAGGRAGTDDAALGAVAWSGQAEQTITVATTGPLTMTPTDEGTATRRPFVIRHPKGRTLVSNAPEHIEAVGRLDSRGALIELAVQLPAAEPTTAERLIAALDNPMSTAALAEAVGLNRTGDRFRKALAAAIDGGLIRKDDDGLYARVADE